MNAEPRIPPPEPEGGATAGDLDGIAKSTLADRSGVPLAEFKKGLRARYLRVWRDLLPGHAVLFGAFAALALAEPALPLWALPPLAVLGALVIGYALAYVELFFHEAAHYNLAPGRARNDRLANLFLGIWMGQNVAQYREIHFDHHRYLGTVRDPERSYFDPLTPRFILEALTGVRVLKVVLVRQRSARGDAARPRRGMLNLHALAGLLVHGALLAGALVGRRWIAAAAWLAGVTLVFPFFTAVRQVLEHRGLDARASVDYSRIDHGAVNRMFGDGPLACTLGGAGFNRHLLHHWEPQISYTRLRELEKYLMETPAAGALARHRTTYWATFRALLHADDTRTRD